MINLFEKLFGSFQLILNMFNKKQTMQNSPSSNQIQGNYNVVNQHQLIIPEIQVNLYGSGAKETFEGDIKNKSGRSVVLKFIEINGIKTEFNQNLTNLIFIRNNEIQIHYPKGIFNKKQDILLKLRFEDIEGNIYEVSQHGNQEPRDDRKFNIIFGLSKYIRIN